MFNKKTTKCVVCKKSFPKRGTQKTCSYECAKENREHQKIAEFDAKYGHIKTSSLFTQKQKCPECGDMDYLKLDSKFIRCTRCISYAKA